PIPYISMPFDRRTAGFLPPDIQLFDGFSPQIDLPFFLPLGDSYDITLTPGLRTNWATDEGNDLDSYGAPRLGTRLRYAPAEGTEGEIAIQYQRDAGNQAVLSLLDEGDPNPCLGDTPSSRCGLVNRFGVDLRHVSALSDSSDLTVNGRWFSDDQLLADASLAVSDRLTNFTASRAQLDLRLPAVYAAAGVDYILRLRGQTSLDNVRGEELSTFHRGPHLEIRLPPLKVFDGIHVEAVTTATRYGAWLTRLFSDQSPLPPSQWVLRTAGSVGYSAGLGPVALRSRIGIDSGWSLPSELDERALEEGFVPIDTEDRRVVSLFADAFAEVPLARSIGSWTHLVVPRAGIRSIPWQDDDATPAALFDPYLARNEITQAVVGVDQMLLDGRGRTFARLLVEQPWDLRERQRLQTAVRAELNPIRNLRLAGSALVATDADDPFREFGTRASYRWGPLSTGVGYTRWFADAERFDRSVYELSGTPSFQDFDPGDPRSEQYVTGRAALTFSSFNLGYSMQRLLRRPGGNNAADRINRGLAASPANQRPFTPLQTFAINYRSPCECWGIGANVVFSQVGVDMPTEDEPFEWDYRINLQFQIGDYVVGTRNR
ncbi:MAG: hypothetical protein AAF658_08015, partial [Myxococcota bacterium]